MSADPTPTISPWGQLPFWIVKRGIWSHLSLNEVKLLGVLIAYGDNSTGECWMTWKQLSLASGVRFKAIGNAMKELKGLGCISRKRRGNRMVNRVVRKEPEFAWSFNLGPRRKRRIATPSRNQAGKFIPVQSESDIPQQTEYDIPLNPEAAKSLASIEEQSLPLARVRSLKVR